MTTVKIPSPRRFATDAERADYIEERFREIMEALDLDLSHDSLIDTPRRVAEMYVYELFAGLKQENFPDITLFKHEGGESTISVEGIHFTSMCEHHFLPVRGKAIVRYIPKGQVIGLSKVHRIVDYYARRPQIQERLTEQIADSLSALLDIEDVYVKLTARHECVCSRGVSDQQSTMTTTVARGRFR